MSMAQGLRGQLRTTPENDLQRGEVGHCRFELGRRLIPGWSRCLGPTHLRRAQRQRQAKDHGHSDPLGFRHQGAAKAPPVCGLTDQHVRDEKRADAGHEPLPTPTWGRRS